MTTISPYLFISSDAGILQHRALLSLRNRATLGAGVWAELEKAKRLEAELQCLYLKGVSPNGFDEALHGHAKSPPNRTNVKKASYLEKTMIENTKEKLHAFKGKTAEEWAKIEADEHDKEYKDAFPFGLETYKFSPERAWWYEDYAYKQGRRRDRGHRTRKVLELMDMDNLSGKRVLDIGCGIGQYSVLFAMKGASVTGVELSKVGVEIARKMALENDVADHCQFIEGDITKQSLEKESYDIVLLHEVFHHVIKYPNIREKIDSFAKKGGKIIMADTVRGAGPIHWGRKLVKFCRRRLDASSEQHEENLGDVLFDIGEYERFAMGYSYYKIIPMSYFYMIKQTFLQYHTDKLLVRLFLRSIKTLDDIILTLFPFLKKGCGEVVLYIEK